ncbi:MAG: SusE domain-containing protein [Prevotellaceae bacterium]|nr:SusE domain-containing protein [Prevotellaceae bacterium]
MKYTKITAGILMGAALLLSACDSDLDNNPTLQTPTTFKLNTPAYSNANLDLKSSSALAFSWSQPDYEFPAAATYQMQIGKTDKAADWTVSTDVDGAVDAGTANYANVGDGATSCTTSVSATDVATALEQIYKWSDNAVPATQTFYARVRAVYAGDTCYSNIVPVTVIPYYVELADAAIDEWYLIGACIGDGKWSNNTNVIGTSVLPMYPEPGQEYNKKTGVGVLTYTGYFGAGEHFKIIHYLDNWVNTTDVVCNGWVFRDGGNDPGDITFDKAGYYKITLDPTNRTCTYKKVDDQNPAVYSEMDCAGDFNSWSTTTAMTPVNTFAGAKNHDWYFDIDASAGATTAKFLSNQSWDVNWGNTDFPWGAGTNGGSNIPVKAGKWRVFFNDITGQYHFIAQ